VALPAFARRRSLQQQSDYIFCLPGSQQQTCSSLFAAVGSCWDRQTDGRTPYRFIDPAPHTMSQRQKYTPTVKVKVKYTDKSVHSLTCHNAAGTHMPYRITQCYLPPDRGDIPPLLNRSWCSIKRPRGDARLSWPSWLVTYIHTYIHTYTYIQIYIAPKIVRTNLRRWKRWKYTDKAVYRNCECRWKMYRDDIPARRRSPIQVLTGLDVR